MIEVTGKPISGERLVDRLRSMNSIVKKELLK